MTGYGAVFSGAASKPTGGKRMKFRVIEKNGWFEVGMLIELQAADRIAQMGGAIVPVSEDEHDENRGAIETVAGAASGNDTNPEPENGRPTYPVGNSKTTTRGKKGKSVIPGTVKRPHAKKLPG